VLLVALLLAAEPIYVDPYADEKELRGEAPRTAPPDSTPIVVSSGPPQFQQWGFTGNVGAVVPLPHPGQLGVHGGLGFRYGMRPPSGSESVYFTPAISVLVAGNYVSTIEQPQVTVAPLDGTTSPLARPRTFGDVGAEVRLELTVSRHRGMLMPDFAAWVSTGTAIGFGVRGPFPTAHVGVGLSIDFVREVAPALGKMFQPETYKGLGSGGGGWGNLGSLGSGGGYAVIGLAVLAIALPIAIVGSMCAVFLAGSASSMANVELRYTALPAVSGVGGYGGLVIGFGI